MTTKIEPNQQSIIDQLELLGLSVKEIILYIELLKKNQQTISQLCTNTNIPRTTIIENIDKLVQKGLVQYKLAGKEKFVVHESPQRLEALLKEKEVSLKAEQEKYEKVTKQLPHLISELRNYQDLASNYPDVKIEHYKGREAVESIYFSEIFTSPIIHCYANTQWTEYKMPKITEAFIDVIRKGNMYCNDILPELYTEARQQFLSDIQGCNNYKMKLMPFNQDLFGIDYTIFNNKIAIMYNDPEPSILLIESKILYTYSLAIYNVIWNLL